MLITEYSQVNNVIWVGELFFKEREREKERGRERGRERERERKRETERPREGERRKEEEGREIMTKDTKNGGGPL